MIADKSMPMFDPDNQWVDKRAVKTMMEAFHLSPETLGKMMETRRNMPSNSGAVQYVGPFRFTFYVTDESRNMFVDVHEPKLGMHLAHADWRNFMAVAQETAKELEEVRGGVTSPAGLQTEIAKLGKRLDILEKSLSGLKTYLDTLAETLAARTGTIMPKWTD